MSSTISEGAGARHLSLDRLCHPSLGVLLEHIREQLMPVLPTVLGEIALDYLFGLPPTRAGVLSLPLTWQLCGLCSEMVGLSTKGCGDSITEVEQAWARCDLTTATLLFSG